MCEIEKKALRETFKKLRLELKSAEKDGRITGRALSLFEDESFFVYRSFGTEVGTEALISALRKEDKQVCVPRIVGKTMLSVPFTGETERVFGIEQPKSGEERTCAVAFVPLLSVDRRGNRLGYGGGYYDRYFRSHPEILRVGLAYEGQLSEELPSSAWDVPLDGAVTEEGLRLFSRRLTARFQRDIIG